MGRRFTSIAGLIVLSSVVLAAQAIPQFRTGVELVQIDVTVLDNRRRPLTGLTASDFTVLDDGVETPIRAFTPVELARPLSSPPGWAGDTSPDAVTNQSYRTPGMAYQDFGCERRLEDARTTMFAAVDRATLTVHSIDPQGLVNASPEARATTRRATRAVS